MHSALNASVHGRSEWQPVTAVRRWSSKHWQPAVLEPGLPAATVAALVVMTARRYNKKPGAEWHNVRVQTQSVP